MPKISFVGTFHQSHHWAEVSSPSVPPPNLSRYTSKLLTSPRDRQYPYQPKTPPPQPTKLLLYHSPKLVMLGQLSRPSSLLLFKPMTSLSCLQHARYMTLIYDPILNWYIVHHLKIDASRIFLSPHKPPDLVHYLFTLNQSKVA